MGRVQLSSDHSSDGAMIGVGLGGGGGGEGMPRVYSTPGYHSCTSGEKFT